MTVLSNTSIGGWTFNAGASAYSITNNFTLAFTGAGIAVNGGSVTINNNSGLSFSNGSTAGEATIDNRWNLNFYDSSSAGSATIVNSSSLFSTLTFNNNSTAGSASITNLHELTFYGNTTAGSATITNYGTVLFDGNSTAGSAQLINGGSSAVVNFWTPGPASDGKITAGSIAGSGRFDLNSTELTVGSNNLSTEVTGVLTGDGLTTGTSLIKTGTGTLTLSGTNTYTGATTVDHGTLLVTGSIASSPLVLVNPGASLGGTGTVATTFLDSGATLAPGTPGSIGTLTVQGNLTFCNCSIYAVKVSPTGADKTVVTGQAALGGTVQATALAGSFRGQTYTILNATGGLGGTTFDSLTFTGSSISPGARNPHLTYDANNVFLVLDPGTLQLSPGASGNQSSVAGGINAAVLNGGTPPAAFDALLNMSGTQQGNALNQVSGQPGASSTQSAFNAMQQFMATLGGSAGNGEGGVTSFADEALGYASAGKRDAKAREAYAAVTPHDRRAISFERRWGVWATGYGGSSTVNGSTASGTSTTTSRVYGTVVGADYRLTPDTRVGFALGGAGYNFSLSDGLGSGRADLFQMGLYGRHNFGAAYVASSLAYGWQDVTTDRTITVSGTDKLTANFKANTLAGRTETGWRFVPSPMSGIGVTPYAALQVTSFRLPGYGETATSGSNAFALSYSAQTTTNLRSELGTRLDKALLVRGGLLTLRGRLAWAHDSNTDRPVTAAFQALPGSSFTVNGAQPAADAALVSAGARMDWLNGISLAGSFEGEFSSTTRSYAGKATLRYDW
ncbi:MAG: autotransporter domain-containing protein [Proteobacteria bacterium]|nr:autotransporter domain-containing protein [Pseudomonadota bacterium]